MLACTGCLSAHQSLHVLHRPQHWCCRKAGRGASHIPAARFAFDLMRNRRTVGHLRRCQTFWGSANQSMENLWRLSSESASAAFGRVSCACHCMHIEVWNFVLIFDRHAVRTAAHVNIVPAFHGNNISARHYEF